MGVFLKAMEDILGKNFAVIFGLSLSVMALSACESVSNVWHGKTSTQVTMREDNANVIAPLTPELLRENEPAMPTGYNMQGGVVGYDGIDVSPVVAFPPAVDPMIETMNNTGDSSVTIFSLDGADIAPIQNYGDFPDVGYQSGGIISSNQMPAYSGASPQTQIFFKHGSSRLGSGDMQKLSQVAKNAPMYSGRLSVEGYASRSAQTSDPVRNSILNLKESMNRAYAVSKTLIQKGVPSSKLKTTAYGDTVPSGDEAYQRRVDIISSGY